MFRLRQEQVDRLTHWFNQDARAEMFDALVRAWPQRVAARGLDGFRADIEVALTDADGRGIARPDDVLRFLNICVALGGNFVDDPRYPWARRILDAGSLTMSVRIRLLVEQTRHELAIREWTPPQ